MRNVFEVFFFQLQLVFFSSSSKAIIEVHYVGQWNEYEMSCNDEMRLLQERITERKKILETQLPVWRNTMLSAWTGRHGSVW